MWIMTKARRGKAGYWGGRNMRPGLLGQNAARSRGWLTLSFALLGGCSATLAVGALGCWRVGRFILSHVAHEIIEHLKDMYIHVERILLLILKDMYGSAEWVFFRHHLLPVCACYLTKLNLPWCCRLKFLLL